MKTLKIPDELHRKIKVFCAENNLKINEWVEKELNSVLLKWVWELDTPDNQRKMWTNVEEKLKIDNDTNEDSSNQNKQ
jgi:hypothetical protein